MPIKYSLFLVALILGIGAAKAGQSFKIAHHECSNWSKETLARPLFTLEEGKHLLNRKVRFKNSELYPQNKGRIGFLEMVAQDKFFIMIDWSIDPQEGKEKLTLYDKDALAHLEFED